MTLKQAVYFLLGLLFLGIGIVGTVLPGIPTTPCVLASAWFFSKSSKRMEDWLLNHQLFGKLIKDWRANGSISKTAKRNAVLVIIPTFALSIYVISIFELKVFLAIFCVFLCGFLISRPLPTPVKV
tara:strand:- start:2019 stop:2396 length:378 start_codon:yes stop_codon:yes gene_type:complete